MGAGAVQAPASRPGCGWKGAEPWLQCRVVSRVPEQRVSAQGRAAQGQSPSSGGGRERKWRSRGPPTRRQLRRAELQSRSPPGEESPTHVASQRQQAPEPSRNCSALPGLPGRHPDDRRTSRPVSSALGPSEARPTVLACCPHGSLRVPGLRTHPLYGSTPGLAGAAPALPTSATWCGRLQTCPVCRSPFMQGPAPPACRSTEDCGFHRDTRGLGGHSEQRGGGCAGRHAPPPPGHGEWAGSTAAAISQVHSGSVA